MVNAGGIAWWAHIGGFLAGVLVAPLFLKKSYKLKKRYPSYDKMNIEEAWID